MRFCEHKNKTQEYEYVVNKMLHELASTKHDICNGDGRRETGSVSAPKGIADATGLLFEPE